jgi:hypothetical protein
MQRWGNAARPAAEHSEALQATRCVHDALQVFHEQLESDSDVFTYSEGMSSWDAPYFKPSYLDVTKRLTRVIASLPDVSVTAIAYTCTGYRIIASMYHVIALVTEIASEDATLVKQFDPLPAVHLARAIAEPSATVDGELAHQRAVLLRDFDFPAAKPTLVNLSGSYLDRRQALRAAIRKALSDPDDKPIRCFMRSASAFYASDPGWTCAQLVQKLMMCLPAGSGVTCMIRRAEGAGTFSRVMDHTHPDGPYRISFVFQLYLYLCQSA